MTREERMEEGNDEEGERCLLVDFFALLSTVVYLRRGFLWLDQLQFALVRRFKALHGVDGEGRKVFFARGVGVERLR